MAAAAASTDNGSCCPDGSWPALKAPADYTPKGKMVKEGDVDLCTVGDASSGKAIIVITDIFGINGGRVKGICDQYASEGFLVVMPDLLDGLSAEDKGGFPACVDWLKTFTWAVLEGKLKSAYKYLADNKITSTGAIGFCWGSWVVFHMSAGTNIQCGVSFHPSLIAAPRWYGEVEAEIVDAVQCPQFVYPAGNDPANIQPGGELTEMLAAKPFGSKCEFGTYKEQQHGFMVRGDVSNAEVARDVKDGMEKSIKFFKANL